MVLLLLLKRALRIRKGGASSAISIKLTIPVKNVMTPNSSCAGPRLRQMLRAAAPIRVDWTHLATGGDAWGQMIMSRQECASDVIEIEEVEIDVTVVDVETE
jgi:hypothetical protein